MSVGSIDTAKVLVVGDSGVGKTTLAHLICHSEPCNNPSATIGCSVEVKIHEFRAGTPTEKDYFIELWDVGGSSSHRNSRSLFYHQVHGIILVHDLTNRKSHKNLRKWLAEIFTKDFFAYYGMKVDTETFAGNQIPILLIGNKMDCAEMFCGKNMSRRSAVAEECGADELKLDCMNSKHLAPGSTNSVKLSKFFDKVIERRCHVNQGLFSPQQTRRTTGKRLHAE